MAKSAKSSGAIPLFTMIATAAENRAKLACFYDRPPKMPSSLHHHMYNAAHSEAFVDTPNQWLGE
jgi:hypothetical protein